MTPAPSTWAGSGCRIYVTALVVFLSVAVTLLFLPQFTNNKWVFLGVVVIAAIWWATGLKARLAAGDAGADYAKTHNSWKGPVEI